MTVGLYVCFVHIRRFCRDILLGRREDFEARRRVATISFFANASQLEPVAEVDESLTAKTYNAELLKQYNRQMKVQHSNASTDTAKSS